MPLTRRQRQERISYFEYERRRVGKWPLLGVGGGFVFGFVTTVWGTYSDLPTEARTTICSLITIIGGLLGYLYYKKRKKEIDESIKEEWDAIIEDGKAE